MEELHSWIVKHLAAHPLFERVTDEETNSDPVFALIYDSSEEGQKVTRNQGSKWAAVFRRKPNPEHLEQRAIAVEDSKINSTNQSSLSVTE